MALSYLTCDGCGVRFEHEVQHEDGASVPRRNAIYATILEVARTKSWDVSGIGPLDTHRCPKCGQGALPSPREP